LTEARLDFWSRRKARVKAEAEAEKAALETARMQEQQQALEEKPDEEILAELDLPDPDQMQPGDDFSAFMKSVVPERIRRRALRRLWLSNSVLANVDGLVDYGEDFTDAATVIENLQTAYQVGKGMLSHVEALAAQEEAAAEPGEAEAVDESEMAAAEAVEPGADDGTSEPKPEPDQDALALAADPAGPAFDVAAETEEPLPARPVRRRMRFAVAEETA